MESLKSASVAKLNSVSTSGCFISRSVNENGLKRHSRALYLECEEGINVSLQKILWCVRTYITSTNRFRMYFRNDCTLQISYILFQFLLEGTLCMYMSVELQLASNPLTRLIIQI